MFKALSMSVAVTVGAAFMLGVLLCKSASAQYYDQGRYGGMSATEYYKGGAAREYTYGTPEYYESRRARERASREQIGETIYDHNTGSYHILKQGVPGCPVSRCGYAIDKW